MKRGFVILIFLFSHSLRAEPMKEFLMSCTYGVLAGTLVGTATLAFTDKPGENLQAIARGASLGLYAGILLGAYVVYVVPNQGIEEEENLDDVDLEELGQNRLQVFPTLSKNWEIDGVGVTYRLLDF